MAKRKLKEEVKVSLVLMALSLFTLGGMALMGYLETIWNIKSW